MSVCKPCPEPGIASVACAGHTSATGNSTKVVQGHRFKLVHIPTHRSTQRSILSARAIYLAPLSCQYLPPQACHIHVSCYERTGQHKCLHQQYHWCSTWYDVLQLTHFCLLVLDHWHEHSHQITLLVVQVEWNPSQECKPFLQLPQLLQGVPCFQNMRNANDLQVCW
jgi:hypothetical protein